MNVLEFFEKLYEKLEPDLISILKGEETAQGTLELNIFIDGIVYRFTVDKNDFTEEQAQKSIEFIIEEVSRLRNV